MKLLQRKFMCMYIPSSEKWILLIITEKTIFKTKYFLYFRKKFKALHLRYLLNTTLLFFMLAKISQPFSAFLIVFLYSTSLSFSSSEGFYIARDHIVSFCFSFLQKDLDVLTLMSFTSLNY